MMTESATQTLAGIGARSIPEFDGVHDVWPRGARLHAVREAATRYKERFKTQGKVRAVKSVDIAAAPYPVKYGFHDAVSVPTLPLTSMINRMIVVQYDDWNGTPRTLAFEPTMPDGTAEAPFYRHLQKLMDKVPGGRLVERAVLKYYREPDDVLATLGLAPDDIDFCTFDHLHVQDPRMILGSTETIEGGTVPRRPLFGDARMLVHGRELDTLHWLHPMQWAWYVEGSLTDVDPDKFVTFDGDIALGPGVALLWTPGHTDDNHSLVITTLDGVWVSSENGISLDNWQPEISKIPGVREYHETFGREICPNANTLEDSLDQYDSMVKEKTLADPSQADPRWLQILPSTELAPWKRFWPVVPTRSTAASSTAPSPRDCGDGRASRRRGHRRRPGPGQTDRRAVARARAPGHRDRPRRGAAKAAAEELGTHAAGRALDVRDTAQVTDARDDIMARAGRLDVWVNNAGVLATGPAWQQDDATRRLMIDVNTLGTINGTIAAIESMREHGGHIVNIVSLAGLTPVPGEAVYAASKHAAIGFSLSTLLDLRLTRVKDIDISCVCPDGIWTPMLHDKLEDPGPPCRSPASCCNPNRS